MKILFNLSHPIDEFEVIPAVCFQVSQFPLRFHGSPPSQTYWGSGTSCSPSGFQLGANFRLSFSDLLLLPLHPPYLGWLSLDSDLLGNNGCAAARARTVALITSARWLDPFALEALLLAPHHDFTIPPRAGFQ